MKFNQRAQARLTAKTALYRDSWCRFDFDSDIANWIAASLSAARASVTDPANAHWHRCGGTWFAGVNALPNDHTGSVKGGLALAGSAIDFIHQQLGFTDFQWDRAQVSVIYPGYPKPMQGESEAAFGYRLRRDAAHVDGIKHSGPERRRLLGEQHAFVLGIPMYETMPDAAPLVVWQRSHEIVRQRLTECYRNERPQDWQSIDITDSYHALRREVFEKCERVKVWLQPGEACLVHRLALHGMSPWPDQHGNSESQTGRMICYFRPAFLSPEQWLHQA